MTEASDLRGLLDAIEGELEGRERGYADVRGELLFRSRDLLSDYARLQEGARLDGEAMDKAAAALERSAAQWQSEGFTGREEQCANAASRARARLSARTGEGAALTETKKGGEHG